MLKEETYLNKKATPVVEKRPAVTTKKTLNRQDARNPMPDPKSEMIEKNQKVTQDEIEGAKQAQPEVEGRPAVTTQKTLDSTFKESSMPDPKKSLIKQQQQSTRDEMNAAQKAKPAIEGRPAVITKKNVKTRKLNGFVLIYDTYQTAWAKEPKLFFCLTINTKTN